MSNGGLAGLQTHHQPPLQGQQQQQQHNMAQTAFVDASMLSNPFVHHNQLQQQPQLSQPQQLQQQPQPQQQFTVAVGGLGGLSPQQQQHFQQQTLLLQQQQQQQLALQLQQQPQLLQQALQQQQYEQQQQQLQLQQQFLAASAAGAVPNGFLGPQSAPSSVFAFSSSLPSNLQFSNPPPTSQPLPMRRASTPVALVSSQPLPGYMPSGLSPTAPQPIQGGSYGYPVHYTPPTSRHQVKAEADQWNRRQRLRFQLLRTPQQRLVWTKELHRLFLQALNELGEGATPKSILQWMGVEGLTRENVSSHLQKYRQRMAKPRQPKKRTKAIEIEAELAAEGGFPPSAGGLPINRPRGTSTGTISPIMGGRGAASPSTGCFTDEDFNDEYDDDDLEDDFSSEEAFDGDYHYSPSGHSPISSSPSHSVANSFATMTLNRTMLKSETDDSDDSSSPSHHHHHPQGVFGSDSWLPSTYVTVPPEILASAHRSSTFSSTGSGGLTVGRPTHRLRSISQPHSSHPYIPRGPSPLSSQQLAAQRQQSPQAQQFGSTHLQVPGNIAVVQGQGFHPGNASPITTSPSNSVQFQVMGGFVADMQQQQQQSIPLPQQQQQQPQQRRSPVLSVPPQRRSPVQEGWVVPNTSFGQ